MSKGKLTLISLLASSLLVATQFLASAGETNKLRIRNDNSSAITLNSQSPGFCGTWIGGTVSGAPPATVAANSYSPVFHLVTSGCSGGINVATMQYVGSNGELVYQCTYTITGNDTFTYSASSGCSVVFDPQGNTDFVFPNLGGAKTRGLRIIR
jgi:hypothetical protein